MNDNRLISVNINRYGDYFHNKISIFIYLTTECIRNRNSKHMDNKTAYITIKMIK